MLNTENSKGSLYTISLTLHIITMSVLTMKSIVFLNSTKTLLIYFYHSESHVLSLIIIHHLTAAKYIPY